MHTTLIEAAQLARHCNDPDWAILDCRFELTRPDWGRRAYEAGHVPHALYAHLDLDLSGPVTAKSGRHPLPKVETLASAFGSWGIDGRVQLIAYDQGNGAHAARLWWLARWVGHARVAVLDAGFAAWQQAGLPVSVAPGTRPTRQFVGRPGPASVVTTEQLERWVAAGELTGRRRTLIDARGADRFAGRNEAIDPVAGHIPGARNHPFAHNLGADGRFLPAPELRSRWLETLAGQDPERVVAMCGSGVTACHNLLSMELAGLPGAHLYAGSWSEWIREPDRPIETGP